MKNSVRPPFPVLWLLLPLVCCQNPQHVFDNPVDPASPVYLGTPSLDADGDGVGRYGDVDEIDLLSPADGFESPTASPPLTVFRFDPDLVKRYRIQISTDSAFASTTYDNDAFPSNACQVPKGILANHTAYFWRAKAFDGTKWSGSWSGVRGFTVHVAVGTAGSPAPAAGADVDDSTPLLDWSDVTGASGYDLQVSESAGFAATVVAEQGILVSQFTVPSVLQEKTYYWRIRVRDADGVLGDWGGTWSFRVQLSPRIVVKQGQTAIPSASGSYSFGTTVVGSLPVTVDFTIGNAGTKDLVLSGSPKVAVTGTGAALFTVASQPNSPVVPGGSTAFTLSFTPSAAPGTWSAAVSLPCSDATANPCTFSLSAVCAYAGTVGTPSFNPPPGTYTGALTVSVSTTPADAAIYYTLNGSEPTAGTGTLYTVPIGLSEGATIKAKAFKQQWGDSTVATGVFYIGTVGDPIFSVPAGTYTTAQSVTISTATTGATIRYTTDGSTPTASTGTVYSGALSVSSSQTLTAAAFKAGMADSAVTSAAYNITGKVANPSVDPSGGYYATGTTISFSTSTPGAYVKYQINSLAWQTGNSVALWKLQYGSPVTLKVRGFKTDWDASDIITNTYTLY